MRTSAPFQVWSLFSLHAYAYPLRYRIDTEDDLCLACTFKLF